MSEDKKTVTVPVNDALGLMLNSAVRYALGRRTYIVSSTCRYITPLIAHLDDRTLQCMARDIEEHRKNENLGDACDKADWLTLQAAIINELVEKRGLKLWEA